MCNEGLNDLQRKSSTSFNFKYFVSYTMTVIRYGTEQVPVSYFLCYRTGILFRWNEKKKKKNFSTALAYIHAIHYAAKASTLCRSWPPKGDCRTGERSPGKAWSRPTTFECALVMVKEKTSISPDAKKQNISYHYYTDSPVRTMLYWNYILIKRWRHCAASAA